MANRYWVGGTAAWDGTAGTKWALTSGAAGGQAIPTSADDVFFDAASGAVTCTISTGNTGAKSITCTGFTGTLAGIVAISVSGSVTLVSGMTVTYSGTLSVIATATVTSAGKTIGGVTVNGTGITVTLADALNFGTNTLTVTAGTFDTANYNVTGGSFSTSGASTRSVLLGTSTVTLSSASAWMVTGINPLTTAFTSSTIVVTNAIVTFSGGGVSYGTVNFTSTAATTHAITGGNTFGTLAITPNASAGITEVTFGNDQTITTLTASGATATRRIFIASSTFGTPRILTVTTLTSLSDIDFQDITAAGAASWTTGTRLGDCKGNTGITFDASKTVYWNLSGAQNWGATGWATTSTGTPAANNFPLAQDTATFTDAGSVTGTITIGISWNLPAINMSARTTPMTLSITVSVSVYGNWINGSGTGLSGTGGITFSGRGSQAITSAAQTFTQGITINSPSGTVTLQDALTTNRASAGAATLTNGTLDLNNNTLTLSATATATFRTATGTKNLTFNGGSVVIASSGATAFNNAIPTGFTTTAGTGTGSISLTSASTKTFVGAGSTFNCTLNQGGAGALSITGSNTFANITSTYSAATAATTISFANATTTTVSLFTATGASGRLLTLNNSTVRGTTAVIALTGGGSVTTPDYLNVKDLSFTPFVTNGTAPYKWYAGANSTNSGNNFGILFAASTSTAYLITSGTSWTIPSDWASSANTIRLVGGGGGSGGVRFTSAGSVSVSGAGGGGGGYTGISNFSAAAGTVVPIAIGAGGTAGPVGGAVAGTGGTTSWNTTNTATGGTGGYSVAGATTSVGGTGGTGTFTGGTGGVGQFFSNFQMGGGGGGGAAGVNGNGGNGGNGWTGSAAAGGGGGGNGGGTAGANGATGNVGGTGGNNSAAFGGGTSGTAGAAGGGGGGNSNSTSPINIGGAGIDFSNTFGGAGGSGGQGNQGTSTGAVGVAGVYGGGGGGSSSGSTVANNNLTLGAAGGNGLIFIIYTPGAVATATSNFFLMF